MNRFENQSLGKDFELARQICRDLCAGHPEAVLKLYNRYQNFFAAFARRRMFDADQNNIDGVLSNFWIELMNAKSICNFKGKSSLRTYLTSILNRRIIDANRRCERERDLRKIIERYEIDSETQFRAAQSPENSYLDREMQNLVYSSLTQLEEKFPRDANLIKMRLKGLTYEEMAAAEMHEYEPKPGDLKKRTASLKKQFTRDNTGSLAKFKSILDRNLGKESLSIGDLY